MYLLHEPQLHRDRSTFSGRVYWRNPAAVPAPWGCVSSLRPARCRVSMACQSWRHAAPSPPAPEYCGTGRRSDPRTWHEWCLWRSRCLQTASQSWCSPETINNTMQPTWQWVNLTNTYTHTHLTALFPELPGWAGTRKVKTNLDFTEARDSEWQWHQLGHMQVCTSLQTDI